MKVKDILFEEIWEENKKRLNNLKKSIGKIDRNNEWVLCLGAGVSISAGLPDWHGLLARMTAEIIPNETYFGLQQNKDDVWINGCDESIGDENERAQSRENQAFREAVVGFYKRLDDMKDDIEYLGKREAARNGKYKFVFGNMNVLESAEYIRNYIEQSIQPQNTLKESKEITEKNINWHINYFIQQICSDSLKYPIDSKEIKKTTLGAVARLLKGEKDSIIHDVITYNYDNLLETYLRSNCKCAAENVHSIIKGNPLPEFGAPNSWNIYHVHGRIPVVECERERMSDEVILTESDYYKEERVNYSWTNTIQTYVLGRANMIFIGFSGADYNFRRLLKYVNQDKGNLHERYIFFSVDDIVNAVFSEEREKGKSIKDCIREMNQDNGRYTYEKLMINYLIHAQTIYWYRNGIKVIWSSIEELPGDLDDLHS